MATIDESLAKLTQVSDNIIAALDEKGVAVTSLTAAAEGIRSIEVGGAVETVNGIAPYSLGNVVVDVGVKSVNGVEPDDDGNVEVQAGVTSVNGKTGAVTLNAASVSALSSSGGTVTGNLTVTGTTYSGTYKATSDARLKEELIEVSFNLDPLNTYHYKLKTDGNYHVGLLAQEVKNVLPTAVSINDKGYMSVDYNEVVAALVAEVKELKARVTMLEER